MTNLKNKCSSVAIILIASILSAVFLPLAAMSSPAGEGADLPEEQEEPDASEDRTRILSALPYVEKKENEITQFVPIESREDMAINPNSVFIRIQVYICPADAQKYYGSKIYIFKLKPCDEITDIAEALPESNFDVNSREGFSYYSTLLSPNLWNLSSGEIYHKFVAGVKEGGKFVPISDARYISGINCLSNKKEIPPASKTKKGLSIQMLGEARLLGVAHTTVNMFLNDFMSAEPSPNTQTHTYGGEDYYFNIEKIAEYDKKIKYLTNEGINVTAVLLISSHDFEPPAQIGGENGQNPEDLEQNAVAPVAPINYLIHPNALAAAQNGGEKAFYYGINTADEKGVKYFEALMSFIADRYVKGDDGYGRICNIILGSDIGRTSRYNYCGRIDIVSYVKDYMRALRICDAAMRSRFGGSRVYVPFGNWFAAKPEGDGDFVNKQIIDLLCEYSEKEGNFIWNVAVNAYNVDPLNPETWKETEPAGDFSTPVITMKNIEVLCNYLNLEKKEYLPDGENRKVILSCQGFSSGDNSKENQELQAAAFVYAYIKAKYTPDITAFIYHAHVDSKNEVGSLGLWTHADDTTNDPGEKKKIYDVFKYMDTNREADKIEFAKTIIGIEDFSEIAKLYSKDAEPAVMLTEIAGSGLKKTPNQTYIGLFNDARLSGFIGSSNVSKMGMVKYENPDSAIFDKLNMLFAGFSSPARGDFGGISKIYTAEEEALDLQGEKYVGVNLRIDTLAKMPDDFKIQLILIMESDSALSKPKAANETGGPSAAGQNSANATGALKVFEGLAYISPNKDESVYFDISSWEYKSEIKKIKLLVNPYYASPGGDLPDGGESGESAGKYDFNLYVRSIVSAHDSSISVFQGILIFLLVLILIVVGGYGALYVRARIIKKKRREARELQRKLAREAVAAGRTPPRPPRGSPAPQRGAGHEFQGQHKPNQQQQPPKGKNPGSHDYGGKQGR